MVAFVGRIGSGIFMKSAEEGADIVGRVEERISKDSPRNPASVASIVGNLDFDVAGAVTDQLTSLSSAMSGCLLLSAAITNSSG